MKKDEPRFPLNEPHPLGRASRPPKRARSGASSAGLPDVQMAVRPRAPLPPLCAEPFPELPVYRMEPRAAAPPAMAIPPRTAHYRAGPLLPGILAVPVCDPVPRRSAELRMGGTGMPTPARTRVAPSLPPAMHQRQTVREVLLSEEGRATTGGARLRAMQRRILLRSRTVRSQTGGARASPQPPAQRVTRAERGPVVVWKP